MISHQCLKCGKVLQIPDQYAGQKGSCKKCGGEFIVPDNPDTLPTQELEKVKEVLEETTPPRVLRGKGWIVGVAVTVLLILVVVLMGTLFRDKEPTATNKQILKDTIDDFLFIAEEIAAIKGADPVSFQTALLEEYTWNLKVYTLGELGRVHDEPKEGEAGPTSTETIVLPGNVPLEMVWIHAGTFMMGRYPGEQDNGGLFETPQHQVTLTQGFWLGKYEVTQAQWEAVMGTKPWLGHNYVLDDPDSPAVFVGWTVVQDFITELNAQMDESFRLPNDALMGESFRLPTEAEWEYACRAGTTTRFSYGDDPDYSELFNYAWWNEDGLAAGEEYARKVGQKLPNPWGLYDMHGNVWEKCQDWFGNYPSRSATDPTGPPSGSYRIFRGGGWASSGDYCRSAYRSYSAPEAEAFFIGFRLAR